MTKYLIAGIVALSLLLIISVRINFTSYSKIGKMDASLAERSAEVQSLKDRIKKIQTTDGDAIEAAAKACGLEGVNAFDRGVSVGIAVCEARQ